MESWAYACIVEKALGKQHMCEALVTGLAMGVVGLWAMIRAMGC